MNKFLDMLEWIAPWFNIVVPFAILIYGIHTMATTHVNDEVRDYVGGLFLIMIAITWNHKS